jgi:hypothetical protein
MCNPQTYVKVCVWKWRFKNTCENEGLRILVKWVYEQNQVITMREFVNLNISRSILIDLDKNIC